MGTRGLYGFRMNGEDKLTYNHYDSYPGYLGRNVLKFVESSTVDELKKIFNDIKMVNEEDAPTAEQIEECRKYTDTGVSTGKLTDWYCLLRNAQGDLDAYKNGLQYMIDSNEFIKDSLFCEYCYIINLDTEELEFWSGFQRRPSENNRYGTEKDGNYYPCKMISSYGLREIMNRCFGSDEIVSDMEEMCGKDYDEQWSEVEQ